MFYISPVHVGVAVSDANVDGRLSVMVLPASHYASFDVYPARGYGSENSAMDEWLANNDKGWSQRLLGGNPTWWSSMTSAIRAMMTPDRSWRSGCLSKNHRTESPGYRKDLGREWL